MDLTDLAANREPRAASNQWSEDISSLKAVVRYGIL
jgi:hypothetical protein